MWVYEKMETLMLLLRNHLQTTSGVRITKVFLLRNRLALNVIIMKENSKIGQKYIYKMKGSVQ